MRAIVQRVTSASVQVRSGSAQRVAARCFVLASGEPQAVAVGAFVPTSDSVTVDDPYRAAPPDSGNAQRVTAGLPCVRPAAGAPADQPYTAEIGPGLCLLVGVHTDDTPANAKKLAEKIANLRIFNDGEGKMNRSLLDNPSYDILAVSNFTVYGDTKKNRRPSFTESAPYEKARDLFDQFVANLRTQGFQCPTGVFGADMEVTITNDGPVTLIVDA